MGVLVAWVKESLRPLVSDNLDEPMLDAWLTDLANAAVLAMGQWRPIETAPKDGKQFLVWDGDARYDVAAWHRDHVCGEREGWCYFSHWMPIPPPPTPDRNRNGHDRETGHGAEHESGLPEGSSKP